MGRRAFVGYGLIGEFLFVNSITTLLLPFLSFSSLLFDDMMFSWMVRGKCNVIGELSRSRLDESSGRKRRGCGGAAW